MALSKQEKENLVKEFGQASNDTGSTQVQVALLTKDIERLTDHCRQHPKDVSTNRGLLRMVNRRRNFLRYLSEKDQAAYKDLVKRLGLRK